MSTPIVIIFTLYLHTVKLCKLPHKVLEVWHCIHKPWGRGLKPRLPLCDPLERRGKEGEKRGEGKEGLEEGE
jgi:hypothetical protein